jgi:hypothetical protein
MTIRNNNFVRIPSFAAVPLLVAYVVAYFASIETIEVVVEDKSAGRHHRAMEQSPFGPAMSPGATFLVYSADEVFKVDTDYLFFEFASAERYNSMNVGQRYTVTVAGWRIPALHWYRNIVRVGD